MQHAFVNDMVNSIEAESKYEHNIDLDENCGYSSSSRGWIREWSHQPFYILLMT